MQPPTMPRPDLAHLGIRHRRIPVLAIGRDVYVDTRLMLRRLEQLCPSVPPLGPSSSGSAEARAVERLLDTLTVDSGLFLAAARLIPENMPLIRDPVFQRDRLDFFGKQPTTSAGGNSADATALRRAEALVEVRYGAALLESTLLADGRDWILGTPTPSVADIEAIFPFHWLASMPGALLHGGGGSISCESSPGLSPAQFPRLFAWIDRFGSAVRAARKAQPAKPRVLDGPQAAAAVLAAPFVDSIAAGTSSVDTVDTDDPVAQAAGLRAGMRVVLRPTDTGMSGRDVGRLLRLTADEVVLELDTTVRLHAPRHGFVVRPWKEEDDREGGARL